jgi:NAD(P)-dependent dehydrogenase (short-subunit alcohol dehydrogenase family)
MAQDKFRLDGKVGLITGGGRGIGRAIALAFSRVGAAVAVAARTDEETRSVADEIAADGGRALAVHCDVLDREQVLSMVAGVEKELGGIDILVNNAGGGCAIVPFLDLPEDVWDLHVARNLKSVFLCSQAVGRSMAGRVGGTMINISSVMGLGPHPLRSPYSAAKAGVVALTQTLSVELAPHNIRVNAIAPGFIEVARYWKQFPNYEQTVRKARLAKVPSGRMGRPEDVADLAVFLASDASSYINGQVIRQDGGLVTTVYYKSEDSRAEWW